MAGHGDRDGDRSASGGGGEIAGGRFGAGGKDAVFIHRAHGRVRRPGVAGILRHQGEVSIGGAGLQVHALVGLQGQTGDGGAGGLIGQGDGAGGAEHRHGGLAGYPARRGGDLDGAARLSGSKHAGGGDGPIPVADGPGHIAAVAHGVIGAVHDRGVQGDAGPGEEQGVVGRDIDMVGLAGGLQLGDQEQAGAHRPQAAGLGGLVDDLHAVLGGQGGPQGGGAAAVQAHHVHAAQLDHPLGHLGEGSPHAVAGLAAVDGVDDHGAVGLDAYGGAGGGGGAGVGANLAVGDDAVEAAQSGDGVVPAGVGAGYVDVHRIAGLEAGGHVHQPLVVGLVDGQHHLTLGDGDGAGGLQYLLHHAGDAAPHLELVGLDQGGVDLGDLGGRAGPPFSLQSLGIRHVGGRLVLRCGPVLRLILGALHGLAVVAGHIQVHVHRLAQMVGDGGEDDVDAGAGVLGGLAVIVGIEVVAAGGAVAKGGAGLVHVGDLKGIAGEGGGHRDGGPADEGGAVLPEAHGVKAAGGGAEDPIGDEHTQGVAGGHVIKIAVDAAHHPVALGLQALGHGGQGLLVQHLVAVDHRRVDAGAGGVCKVAFGAQVGLGIAPEDLAGQLHTGGQAHRAGMQVVAKCLRRGGHGGEPQQQRQGEGRGPSKELPHSLPPKQSHGWV